MPNPKETNVDDQPEQVPKPFLLNNNLNSKPKANFTKQGSKHLCDICGHAFEKSGDLKMHKTKIHSLLLCDECDFLTVGSRELQIHKRRVHKFHCPDCNMDIPGYETPETHQCPKVLGPGKPTEDQLKGLVVDKYIDKSILRSSEGKYLCLECGLWNPQKRFTKDHVKVI